ncbi:MAG: UBP-type zinc finger domain-containing protein [Acidimicrobiales bacterium]
MSDFAPPEATDSCPECIREGTTWVALRECRCGHVGCCDSSPGAHATKHFHSTDHPVMRSIMPRDTWDWCYVHEVQGQLS